MILILLILQKMKFQFKLSSSIVLLLIASACKNNTISPTPPTVITPHSFRKDSINVTTFGASTVKGVGGFSFQQDLKNKLQLFYQNKTITVTTNGVAGETTTQGLKRYKKALAGRTGYVVVIIGLNDAIAISKNLMTIKETESNMRYFVAQAERQHLVPIIGTLQFINSGNNKKLMSVNSNIEAINELYKQIRVENSLVLADINVGLGYNFSLYQDTYHPNEKGYAIIAEILFKTVNQLLKKTNPYK